MASISTSRRAPARVPRRLLVLRSDEVLAARGAAGDDIAFEVLYERHVGGVLSFCRHMLGGVEEAEDAAQHSFAALHGELRRGAGELHLRPWLYTVARNRCLSILRARRERPDDALDPETAGLTDEVERRADLRELLADLHDLPTDQRAALVLSELGDLTQAEVGEVLDTDAAKVKGLVFRARSGLIERREARAASCTDIRRELATARRGALRRGRLRHHLRACPDCTAYLGELRRQRRMMALLLPVVPSVGLKRGIFAAAGLGTGAGVGGVALSKVVVIGAVAGTAAVAGGTAAELAERDGAPPAGTAERRDAAPDRRPAGSALGGADRSGPRGARPAGGFAAPDGRRTAGVRGGPEAGGRGLGSGAGGRAREGGPAAPPGLGRRRANGRGATPPGVRGGGRGPVPRSERPGQRVGPAGDPGGRSRGSRGAPAASEGGGGGRAPSGARGRDRAPSAGSDQAPSAGGSQPRVQRGSERPRGSGSQRAGGDSPAERPAPAPPATTPRDGG